jgi:predicted DNA-binding transcriptional regulator AlpA
VSDGTDLMGMGEVALLLGMDARRAYAITKRRDFPTPAAQVTGGRIWLAADIEAWIAEHRPPPDQAEA